MTAAKWIGTGAGVSGAIMTALNLGLVIYGFGLFLISSLLWSVIGWLQRNEPARAAGHIHHHQHCRHLPMARHMILQQKPIAR